MSLLKSKTILFLAIAWFAVLVLARPSHAESSFGDLGVGTQVVMVRGEDGNTAGAGFGLHTRFLWILGLDISGTDLSDTATVWGSNPWRVDLVLQLVDTDRFDFQITPGLSGQTFGDAFNPVGDTTWYRLGGGFDVRLWEGLNLGAALHWTVPGENQIDTYIDQYGDQMLTEFVGGLGADAEVPTSLQSLTVSDAIDQLPLDRFEITIGLSYYFF
ncbi:MAG: hypothetical protein KC561_05090 [Myxococcales bacterium]|nr:hypothetical protein [Myxococcales bacterium]